jgi:hypothetical protein
MDAPKDKASDSARVYNLNDYRTKRDAPLQAAKDRHPAFRERKRREEENNEES